MVLAGRTRSRVPGLQQGDCFTSKRRKTSPKQQAWPVLGTGSPPPTGCQLKFKTEPSAERIHRQVPRGRFCGQDCRGLPPQHSSPSWFTRQEFAQQVAHGPNFRSSFHPSRLIPDSGSPIVTGKQDTFREIGRFEEALVYRCRDSTTCAKTRRISQSGSYGGSRTNRTIWNHAECIARRFRRAKGAEGWPCRRKALRVSRDSTSSRQSSEGGAGAAFRKMGIVALREIG